MESYLQGLAERLESVMALKAPNCVPVMERLRIGVEGVFLMNEELHSIEVCHLI